MKIIFTALLTLLAHMFVSVQTEPYENLLDHRSGFGNEVTGGAGGELIILNSLDYTAFKSAGKLIFGTSKKI